MRIHITTSVVTSRGVIHHGGVADLPDAEATALIRMGRAVPCEDTPAAPEHRESAPPVVRRSRKKAEADDAAD